MTLKAKSYILNISPYQPGLSKIDNNNKIIKLSSNENALGTSPKALEAYQQHINTIYRYPDGSSILLKIAIAKKHHIDTDKIVCGAGSDEIIALLCQSFVNKADEVLYSQYGFLMYNISAKRVGAKPIIAKETNLTTDVNNILSKVSNKTKIIFIANPNNPTGSYINSKELEKLIKVLPKNIMVVLDLAYAEFVDLDDYPNGIDLVNKYENVVMIRTFSKIYGLASLRLGWSYSSVYVADILNRIRGPFNVSSPTQSAGIAAINDNEFTKQSKLHNDKWLKILNKELTIIGLKPHPSVTNFILIDFLSTKKCQKANQFLLDNGIILRNMTSYKLPKCLRMTIGTAAENLKVIELLRTCLGSF